MVYGGILSFYLFKGEFIMTKSAYQKEVEATLGYSFDPDPKEKLELDFSNWGIWGTGKTNDTLNKYSELTELDVSKWDISDRNSMSNMFDGCYKLKVLDVSKWDTSKVENMRRMFSHCKQCN